MDINDEKPEKSYSEHQNGDVASTTTYKRNIFGRQKTCMYHECYFYINIIFLFKS